jgi:hypothetical protein
MEGKWGGEYRHDKVHILMDIIAPCRLQHPTEVDVHNWGQTHRRQRSVWEYSQHMGPVRRKAQGSLGRGPAPVIQGVRQWHERNIVLWMGKRTGCQ